MFCHFKCALFSVENILLHQQEILSLKNSKIHIKSWIKCFTNMFSPLVFPITVNAFSNSLEALALFVVIQPTHQQILSTLKYIPRLPWWQWIRIRLPTQTGLISGPGRSHVLQLKPKPVKSVNIKTTTTTKELRLWTWHPVPHGVEGGGGEFQMQPVLTPSTTISLNHYHLWPKWAF